MADTSQVKEITSKLEQGVKDLFTSDRYADYLKTMSRFHKYSTRNTLLIHMQKPDATLVAGFRSWQTKFGRNVRKGEKSIKILAPVPFVKREENEKLDPDTRQPIIGDDGLPVVEYTERHLARFKVTSVFDVSQTAGKALPTLVQNLTGDVEQYKAFMDALRGASPLPIVFEAMPDEMDGVCRFGNEIAIRSGMSEIQTVCAVIHEMTHAKLHDKSLEVGADGDAKPKDRRTEEVEAESVSYAVCQYFNIETGDNSFGYLLEWSKSRELKELNASLDTIRKTAAELIDAIDGKFREIVKDRNITLAVGEAQAEMSDPAAAEQTAPDSEPETESDAKPEAEQDKEPEADTDEDKDEPYSIKRSEKLLYIKFAELFPKIASGEYKYLRLEAGDGFMPLSIEWLSDSLISVMHTYKLNGDLCYDPTVTFRCDYADYETGDKYMTAEEYEQSIPPVYQVKSSPSIWYGVDGNGNEKTLWGLSDSINSFASQWFDNISEQGYMPVKANMAIGGETVQVTFDADGNPVMPEPEKEYDLGFGFLGNGVTVWNRTEERDGDYQTVAHISTERDVTIFDKDMPDEVREHIEKIAQSPDTWAFGFKPLPGMAESATSKELTPELDTPVPDKTITFKDMDNYGYTDPDMLPLTQSRAVELFDAGHTVYLLYTDVTESMVFDRDEIMNHDGVFGIERPEWEMSQEYAEMKAESKSRESSRESELLNGSGNRFGIYQVRSDLGESRDYRFVPMEELQALGLDVMRDNYKLVYTAPFEERVEFLTDRYPVLNRIYEQFNTDHPDDYTGRSVSVSDVILLKCNNDISSHYVDRAGFVEIDRFIGTEKAELPQAPDKPAQIVDIEKPDAYSQVGNIPVNEQPAAPKSRPTLMERLAENKVKAARQGQPDAHKPVEREVRA